MSERYYICIDLKSFYASVECAARGLDPMTANLVVADPSRTDKTICLAVSPSMKALGVKNRCRLFEIPKNLDYIIAPPRMQLYIDTSAEIYAIYLRYFSKEDIHVYSVDEAFMDVTDYLALYDTTPRALGQRIMADIEDKLGIRATCGIGTNLYLAKIALDITAKHAEDFIGELDEESYRERLWDHTPLTDFWRIGHGTVRRLAEYGIHTMGEIAACDPKLLYRLFGIDAELLIDHAWGREPVTIADIKAYRPKSNSLTSGQVLPCDYSYEDGRLIVKEMTDLLCLDLVERKLTASSIGLHVGYSNALHIKSADGSQKLPTSSNSDLIILPAMLALYEKILNPAYPIRRIMITFGGVTLEESGQYSFFTYDETLAKGRKMQEAVIELKNKFGKDAVLRGMDLEEKATTRERNHQIGGHSSGT